jgi:hypothetical protein
MPRLSARRRLAVLVFSLVLAAPWYAAATQLGSYPGSSVRQVSAAPRELFGFWRWLTGLWAKEGCIIDPNGSPACKPTSAGEPDPDDPMVNAKEGCILDPNGKPTCSSDPASTDAGCILDPNGLFCGGRQ